MDPSQPRAERSQAIRSPYFPLLGPLRSAETSSSLVITSVEKRAVMADSSLNSLRRTLSVSKERATVSLLDSDERAAVISLSEEHGLKPSEVYGFVGSISTIVTTAIFLAWAYIPECWLHYLGITYYPSRYWALAVPAFAMVTVFLAIGFYLGLNFMVTPPPTSFDTIYGERQSLNNLVFKVRDYSVQRPATKQIVEAHSAPHVGPMVDDPYH